MPKGFDAEIDVPTIGNEIDVSTLKFPMPPVVWLVISTPFNGPIDVKLPNKPKYPSTAQVPAGIVILAIFVGVEGSKSIPTADKT